MREPVNIDVRRGRLTVGTVEWFCSPAGDRGELRLGGDSGPVLHPLTFAERSAAVARAAREPSPVEAVAAAVLGASLQPGQEAAGGAEDDTLAAIVALVLAGAQEDAPPFAETREIAVAQTGLSGKVIDGMAAREVDQLVMRLALPVERLDAQDASGWHRILFVEQPGESPALEAVCTELAQRLLGRHSPAASQSTPELPRAEAAVAGAPVRRAKPDRTPAREFSDPDVRSAASKRNRSAARAEPLVARHGGTEENPLMVARFTYAGRARPVAAEAALTRAPDVAANEDGPRPGSAVAVAAPRSSTSFTRGEAAPQRRAASGDPAVTLPYHAQFPATMHAASSAPLPVSGLQSEPAALPALPRTINVHRTSAPAATAAGLTAGEVLEAAQLPPIRAGAMAVAFADAIATLLNEEADLRGID